MDFPKVDKVVWKYMEIYLIEYVNSEIQTNMCNGAV